MSKIITLAAGAAGYVLGARAGRERFEQIKSQANRVWNDPKVQQAASDAQDVVAQQAPIIKDKAADAASTASSKVMDGAGKRRADPDETAGPVDLTAVETPAPGSPRV